MFNWFQKNRYLADYLEGFVDIHNHILPGIDDGSRSVRESLELLRAFGEMGIHRFVATPHIMQPDYPNTPETISRAHQEVMDALMDQGLTNISIEPAAEHMIDAGFETLLDSEMHMPLKGSYLLVEMSFLQPSLNFDEAIMEITNHGLTPVLAHPERYLYLHKTPQKYQEYKNKGILFQLNMLSLSDFYGKEVYGMAIQLLRQGMIDFIASDLHNMLYMAELREIRLGKKELDYLQPVLNNTIQTFL